MSSSKKIARNKTYTEEDLQKALKEISEQKSSIRQISKKYSIPKSTILDKLSGRRPQGIKKPGPEPALGIEGEKKVVEWLLNISKCGFPVKKQELLDTVQKIMKDGNIKNNFKDNRPGEKWYELFLSRNKEISLKNAEGVNKARALITEESIRLWFRELEEYLKSIQQQDILNDPQRIFNGDESGFALCPKTGKVLGPKGYKNLYQIKSNNEKENITVLLTFNANGDTCPPCVVFPYIRPPKSIVNSMPAEWCLGRSDSGWMRGDVFFEYVTNEFNKWVEENNIKKPVLLLVDGHKSHMSLTLSSVCDQLQIILYALPPNTTHILQPADVSVFAPLKSYWKRTVRNFLAKPENLNSAVTKINFCRLLKDALEHPNMPDNIKNGFKRCGLYPFDPNSPDYTKCIKNTLENLQSANETSPNISHSDIRSFKKVLKELKPMLKEKNIKVSTIIKAANSLKNTLPAEVRAEENSIVTESETSQMEISVVTTEEISINHKEFAEPCTSKICQSDCNFTPSNIDVVNHTNDFSISTLHLSGSYMDIGSIVSLDDILILPGEKMPTPTTSIVEKEATSKEQMLPLTPRILSNIILSPSVNFTTPTTSRVSSSCASFQRHLTLPEIENKTRKGNSRIPAAISSTAWREFYESKEHIKQKKQDDIKKRKLERIEKREKKKTLKESLGKTAPKRRRRNPVEQNENISPCEGIKCAECEDTLISDVEDDSEKNIGCDSCSRWYHLKCTQFVGLSYVDVQDKTFHCNLCD